MSNPKPLLDSEWEVLREQLKSEKAVMQALKEHYDEAVKGIDKRIAELMGRGDANLPHVIRRVEYQKMIRAQITAALEMLHAKEYETISEYLNESYTDAFVGSVYTMHAQDMPVIVPINQSAAAKAVTIDSKLKSDLYSSLGVDITELKKTIAAEVTRGIASGMLYSDMMRNIANAGKVQLSRARTIVRTEAGRVQEQATFDAAKGAKAVGADVVKQWSAILDGKTRDNHRRLDGQIREVEEPFEIDGHKAMHPHDFGRPEEDINCRCTMLTRARAALDADELKRLREDAVRHSLYMDDPKAFRAEKLPPLKSFKEFKKAYLKAAEEVTMHPDIPMPKTLSNYEDTVYWAEDERKSNFELYRGLPEKYHAPFDTFEAETPKYEQQLSKAFEKFDFATNTDSKAIEQILIDGRLKGTVETNTSNGELDVSLRKRATGELFGLWDDAEELEAGEFEKYGYIGTADRAKMYGDCRIVFKKDNLWDRTTFTVGDSLEAVVNGGYKTPSKVSDPKIVSFSKDPFTQDQPSLNEMAIRNIQKAFDSIEEHGYFKGVINNEDYVELQFHGAVVLEDIAYIEVPQKSENLAEILEIAEEKGVKIKVKK